MLENAFPGVLHGLALLAVFAGLWAAVRGVRLLARGLRCADDARAPLWVVRGIRGVVVAVSAWALASGVLFGQVWLLVFGAIFLAEELYETGLLALILRWGREVEGRTGASSP